MKLSELLFLRIRRVVNPQGRRYGCVLAMFFGSGMSVAQQPTWQAPPKLVVGIVVDQMRPDYIYRYWDNFGEGGFKRLIGEGAFLRNTHYTYIPTVTGPGHASIYTGSTPSLHGIVGNDWYDRAERKLVYCVSDDSVHTLNEVSSRRSPQYLQATTLADEIERRTDGKGKTIGVALKDRSSILPIGRTGDVAYWFSTTNGEFLTSTWYDLTELPAWLREFNARKLASHYLDRIWTPLLPMDRYHLALPDANAFEQELTKGSGTSFPYDLAKLSTTAGLGLINTTPWGNTITTDMALAALVGERMGTDSITDLLAISYSSTDILGHKMGPRALEVEDMYIRLDQEIARLLNELDKQVGAGKYTLFLTADHGAVDVPAYLKDLKGSAGYVDPNLMRSRLDSALTVQQTGAVALIDTILEGQVFLRNLTAQNGLMVVQELRKMNSIHAAVTSYELEWGTQPDQIDLLANGFMPQRCGDILYTLKPGYFEAEGAFLGKGTTHGSGWNYDTHVPVIFYGQGIKHAEVVRRTAVADIVPTLTMLIGCALPDAAVGEPVPEVLE